MKDIDFDELDRAVSSVLGGTTPKPDDTGGTTVNTAVADTDSDGMVDSLPISSFSSSNTVDTSLSPVVNTSNDQVMEPIAPTRATPLAIKRRGKFMDVVHPSSDMNRAPAVVTARKSINPIDSITPEETKAEELPASLPAPDADSEVSSNLPVASSSEPVDTTQTDSQEEEKLIPEHASQFETTTDTDTVADAPVVTDAAPMSSQQEDSPEEVVNVSTESVSETDGESLSSAEPATEESDQSEGSSEPSMSGDGFGSGVSSTPETPFLTDAKVEKRPLGGFGEGVEDPSVSEAGSLQTPPVASLPRELQPDVVSVEAIQDDTKPPVETIPTATAPTLATVPAADDVDGGTHSLFDTSTYHEPISHEKKSSVPSWVWWLVGLLLCLAAGAGVGYLLFVTGL